MHARSNDPGTLLALLARCIPCLFKMISRGFVDNRIFCGANWAGEPDHIPASGSGNFRFYGVLYHCFKIFDGCSIRKKYNLISCSIQADKKGFAEYGGERTSYMGSVPVCQNRLLCY